MLHDDDTHEGNKIHTSELSSATGTLLILYAVSNSNGI